MKSNRQLPGLFFLVAASVSANAGDRLMEPKDIPNIRQAQDAQISPDGRLVAFVVSEPDLKENVYQTDIFLVSTTSGDPFRLTHHPKNDRGPH